jgi:hypothetical protein
LRLLGGVNLYGYANANPIGRSDALGLFPSIPGGGMVPDNMRGPQGGQGCSGGGACATSFFDCLANCIRNLDPLGPYGALGLSAVGATFPKSWAGLPQGLGGASSLTTAPSAAAHATGIGPTAFGQAARATGRAFSPAWIGYGVGMAGVELYCLAACASNQCR